MSHLATLPNISSAKLPAFYEKAKVALDECSRIDECKDWADKAEALASYAKQANDDSLRRACDRIQARAIRKMGELLQEIDAAKNQHDVTKRASTGTVTSRKQAADDAGISKRQKDTALRVASVPKEEFESVVESENPPTVTQLAERGKKSQPRPLVDLKGRDPEEFSKSTRAQGWIREMAEVTSIAPEIVVRGAFDHELPEVTKNISLIQPWLANVARLIERESK